MPINKIVATNRGKSAVAAVMAVAVSIGGIFYATTEDGRRYPASVIMAADHLIKPWEGLVLKAHWDRFGKKYDICHGDTLVDGKPVTPGMTRTPEQCDEMLYRRVYADYYLPETRCVSNFKDAPESVQASMISGGYNFGVKAWCGSTAAKMMRAKKYREACEKQTAWNRAGGQVLTGLVRRREMGDAQRIGEAELCVSGL